MFRAEGEESLGRKSGKTSGGGGVGCGGGITACRGSVFSPFALGNVHLFAQIIDEFGRIDHLNIGRHAQHESADAPHGTKIGFKAPFAIVFGRDVFRGAGIFVDEHTATQIAQAQAYPCASGTGEMEQIDEVGLMFVSVIPVQIK